MWVGGCVLWMKGGIQREILLGEAAVDLLCWIYKSMVKISLSSQWGTFEDFEKRSGLADLSFRTSRQIFFLGGLGGYKPHSFFPSSALFSRVADKTQGERCEYEMTHGSLTTESQVCWSFLSLPWNCFSAFKNPGL